MYARLAQYMQWRSDLLMADRLDDLAREYLFPFVMYRGEHQLVLTDPEELVEVFRRLRADHRKRGVVRLGTRVSALDLPRHGRFRVWLDHAEQDAAGRVLAQSDTVLYCRETPEGLRSEMAEYGRCAVPELWTRGSGQRVARRP